MNLLPSELNNLYGISPVGNTPCCLSPPTANTPETYSNISTTIGAAMNDLRIISDIIGSTSTEVLPIISAHAASAAAYAAVARDLITSGASLLVTGRQEGGPRTNATAYSEALVEESGCLDDIRPGGGKRKTRKRKRKTRKIKRKTRKSRTRKQ